jgi:hypothetical protein
MPAQSSSFTGPSSKDIYKHHITIIYLMVYISVPIIITKHHDGKFTVHVQHYKNTRYGKLQTIFYNT